MHMMCKQYVLQNKLQNLHETRVKYVLYNQKLFSCFLHKNLPCMKGKKHIFETRSHMRLARRHDMSAHVWKHFILACIHSVFMQRIKSHIQKKPMLQTFRTFRVLQSMKAVASKHTDRQLQELNGFNSWKNHIESCVQLEKD